MRRISAESDRESVFKTFLACVDRAGEEETGECGNSMSPLSGGRSNLGFCLPVAASPRTRRSATSSDVAASPRTRKSATSSDVAAICGRCKEGGAIRLEGDVEVLANKNTKVVDALRGERLPTSLDSPSSAECCMGNCCMENKKLRVELEQSITLLAAAQAALIEKDRVIESLWRKNATANSQVIRLDAELKDSRWDFPSDSFTSKHLYLCPRLIRLGVTGLVLEGVVTSTSTKSTLESGRVRPTRMGAALRRFKFEIQPQDLLRDGRRNT